MKMAEPAADVVGPGTALRYGAAGFALAAAALPLYLATPHLYAGELGLSLSLVGLLLMATRLVDAVTDPWFGRWIDATPGQRFERWMLPSLGLLCLSLAGLLLPPTGLSQAALLAWMTLMALLVSLSNGVAGLAQQAWVVSWSADRSIQARLVTAREGLTLLGVIVAAALAGLQHQLALVGLVALGALVAGLCLRGLPGQAAAEAGPARQPRSVAFLLSGFASLKLFDSAGRRLIGVLGLNALANAIPGTLFLFFASDQIGASREEAAGLLAAYFLAALVAMPVWLWLLKRRAVGGVWRVSVLLSIAAFIWAVSLGSGDLAAFAVICLITGFALGAELVCPALLLAAAIERAGHRGQHEVELFGLWNLVSKLALALAAGGVLPLLGLLAYTPGTGGWALALCYAGLPCLLKGLALLNFQFLEKTS